MIATEQVEARLMMADDILPNDLSVGFQQLDPYWVWVALEDGRTVAALLAAPCHGMVMLARLAALPGHETVLPRLLRQCIRDTMERGFGGYVCWLNPQRQQERKLLGILVKAGGIVPEVHACVGGKLSDLERW